MSLMMSFESEGVLAEQKRFAKLNDLLASALQQKLPVVLDLGEKQITVGSVAGLGNNENAIVRGQRISTQINIVNPSFRIGICLPFLVNIHQILLPAGSITTFGSPYRPLGDFFMRNVFHSALRRKLRFETSQAASGELSRDLQRCYLWMLKTQFQDAVLQDVELPEKFLRACHFKICLVDSPFFERAAEEIRKQGIEKIGGVSKTEDLSRLMALRTQVMAEY